MNEVGDILSWLIIALPVFITIIAIWRFIRDGSPVMRYVTDQSPVRFGLWAMLGAFVVWLTMYRLGAGTWEGYWGSLYVEFGGAIFDIVIFGVLLAGVTTWHERNREIKRLQEIIDDFKKWDSEEGRLRMAGAIRRLNQLGKHDIDLRGVLMSGFAFKQHEINNISKTVFWDGEWGTGSRNCSARLINVSFDDVNCTDVIFSPDSLFGGLLRNPESPMTLNDCSFVRANLTNVSFRGASLKWIIAGREMYDEWEDDDGLPRSMQIHYPPFDQADLNGASFADAILVNVDFRNALNIDLCDFTNATGLDKCFFDDGVKEQILAQYGLEASLIAKK